MISSDKVEGLLRKKNVVGVGFGFGERKKSSEKVIRVYVEKKVKLSSLAEKDVIPGQIDGFRTDVIETGEIKALGILNLFEKTESSNPRTDRHRPVPNGVSIGNRKITAGTKGFEIIREGKRYAVSNAHVFCEDPRKNVSKQERRIHQPGPRDSSDLENTEVGRLVSHVIISEKGMNRVDTAICEFYNDEDYTNEVFSAGKVITGSESAREGEEVRKVGRTTGLTAGKIVDVNATVRVNYGKFSALFTDQIIIQGKSGSFSSGGDSGSAILNSDGKVVGLLFAGSSEVTVANKIESILSVFSGRIALDKESKEVVVNFVVSRVNGIIRGRVTEVIDGEHVPVPSAKMTLYRKEGREEVETKYTDENGEYFFGASPGQYIISFEKEGYVSQEKVANLS